MFTSRLDLRAVRRVRHDPRAHHDPRTTDRHQQAEGDHGQQYDVQRRGPTGGPQVPGHLLALSQVGSTLSKDKGKYIVWLQFAALSFFSHDQN